MNITPEEIKACIEKHLEGAVVTVHGADGVHFEATVKCSAFAGKSKIMQHRMVYAALGDRMKQAIHALSLYTEA